MAIEMKWQALTQPVDGAICMKVAEGTWVTLLYRNKSANKNEPWLLVPIDKTPPTFLPSRERGGLLVPPKH